eukprot:SAG31_NODE_29510_length_394_cov_0.701695_2_plen_20_part_01
MFEFGTTQAFKGAGHSPHAV